MKPAPFELYQPASVSEALQLAAADEESKYLAGGQSLLAMMNFRLARPSTIIDLSRLRELDRIFDEGESLLIGSLTTHSTLEHNSLIRCGVPLLSKAALHIGHVAIRNQGTLGGTIAHADPAAELPGVLMVWMRLFLQKSMSVDAARSLLPRCSTVCIRRLLRPTSW